MHTQVHDQQIKKKEMPTNVYCSNRKKSKLKMPEIVCVPRYIAVSGCVFARARALDNNTI